MSRLISETPYTPTGWHSRHNQGGAGWRLSWLLLEEHQNFVSAWNLIDGIAQVSNVNLSHAAHLLTRLNQINPVDGEYLIPFYGYRKFDGYFLASESEVDLCIKALKKAILFEKVSFFDGEMEIDISLEDGFKEQKGMNFFFRKQDVLEAIKYKSIEIGSDIPLPPCIITTPEINNISVKSSKKTENAQAIFIKALLTVFYGEDVANNPRRHIDGTSSQIRTDLEAKGCYCPSGVTVEKWLSGID